MKRGGQQVFDTELKMASWAIERETEWRNTRNQPLGIQHDFLYEGLTNITLSSFTASKKNETPIQLFFRNARLRLLKQRRIVRGDFGDQPNAAEPLSRTTPMLRHVDSKLGNLRKDTVLEKEIVLTA